MNPTDLSVAGLLVIGLLGGMRRGLSGELLRVATIIIALVAGWKLAETGAEIAAHWSNWPAEDLKAVAFFAIVAFVYVGLGMIRFFLRLFLDFSFKGKVELLGGAFLGLCRSLVFCVFIVLAATLVPSESVQQQIAASNSGRFVLDYVRPGYDAWVEENPAFKLPEMEKVKDIEITPPEEWNPVTGPLIDPDEPIGE